jgi:hypothetical protein
LQFITLFNQSETCFMSPFWRQKYGGVAYIFGKFDQEQYMGGKVILSYYTALSGATTLIPRRK